MNKDYIYEAITGYIDGKSTDFAPIRMIGSKREIHLALKNYSSLYPNRKDEINHIIANLDELIKNTPKVPLYVLTIDEYFEGKVDFRTIRLLGTKKQVISLLEKYKKYNPSRIDDINNIINNIDEYFETSKLVPKYIKMISLYFDEKISFKELKTAFKSKQIMIDNLIKYKNKYPNKTDEVNSLIDSIDSFINESKKDVLYVNTINNYINGVSTFDDIMELGSISYIKSRFYKYLELYPSRKNIIDKMFVELDKHYKNNPKIINPDLIITRYINGFITNDVINKEFTKNAFLNHLKNYIIKHPENREYVLSIINNIDNIYQLESRECNMTEIIKPVYTKKIAGKELIDDLFYSSLSIEEYCSKTGTSIDKVKRVCVKYTKSDDKDKANIGTILFERSSSEFLQELKCNVLSTLTKEDADIFDYLNITRLSAKDFREVMNGLIPHELIVDILKRVDLYRIDPSNNLHSIVSKEAKIKSKIVIDGREITAKEKENVFDYLEENDYPLCLFNSALKKYVSGKLEITKKVLVKE